MGNPVLTLDCAQRETQGEINMALGCLSHWTLDVFREEGERRGQEMEAGH